MISRKYHKTEVLFNEVFSFYKAIIYKDIKFVTYTEIKLERIMVSLQWNEFC
jgi:hypothetical protein